MHTFFIVLDHPAPFARGAAAMPSLLSVPVGTRHLLGHLCERIEEAGGDRVMVVPTFEPDSEYAARLSQGNSLPCRVVAMSQLPTTLAGWEPSDWLAVLDSRFWMRHVGTLSEMVEKGHSYVGATYWMAVGPRSQGTRERVQCDETGRVRRIQRYYDGVTRPASAEVTIPQAMIPNWAAEGLTSLPLPAVRTQLMQRGVLSRDLPIHAAVADLADERGMLELHEEAVVEKVSGPLPRGYSRLSRGVLVGRGALIHSTARLIPPVIVQDGVLIDQGATVIGPTVVGSGSTLCGDSVVAQAIVGIGTTVSSGLTVRHRVASGALASSAQAESSAEEFSHIEDVTGEETAGEQWSHAGMRDVTRDRATFLLVKRMVDVAAAAAGLVLCLPIMLIAALLIKLGSRGSVFFGHQREGRDGKVFRCWKFRTMYSDAHQKQRDLYQENLVDGPQFKMANDPRVTFIGRFLRATNVDELPQLINVLFGDMSLVGPRPSPFRENQICIPWRRARLSVRPGITGLWQVCRRSRSSGDFQQWIAYDILYVRNMCMSLDVKIILATLLTLGGRWSVPYAWMVPRERRYGAAPRGAAATAA